MTRTDVDLGAYFTATTLAERHGRPARRIRALMQFNGKLSGGTLSTGLLLDGASEAVRPPVASRLLPSRPRAPSPPRALTRTQVQAARRDPFLLGGSPELAGGGGGLPRAEDEDPRDSEYDCALGGCPSRA